MSDALEVLSHSTKYTYDVKDEKKRLILWPVMMKFFILAAAMLFALYLGAQTPIAGSCAHGGTYPACVGGEIVFTSSGYPGLVHVTVTKSSGDAIDDADYTTSSGVLTFTENLSFPDTYSIAVNGKVLLTLVTS
jgi:hypothetical protein